MSVLYWTLAAVVVAMALAYWRAPLLLWTAAVAAAIAYIQYSTGEAPVLTWTFFGVIATVLNILPMRRALLTSNILKLFRKVLPPMSETERTALEAGTTWWDAELFSGDPDWDVLLAYEQATLTEEEQAFIDGPVEELCGMLDDWQITTELNDLPPDVWEFIKKERFFGLIIPEEFGGRGFSATAHSEVVMKVATRSISAAVSVMVPNSLGPGELLLHYGTDEQKAHYLPRLARGEEVPCFALTSPYAGSDAGAIPDKGIVCKEMHEGEEVLGFRTTWDKRYITLGPVSTVLGLAFKAYDPDGLLGDQESLGITCALIPSDTPGVEIGKRHYPLNSAFQNGPVRGEDVFIPLDWVIGGEEQIGNGWTMLMNCLSVGRGISLPALGTGAGKLTSRMTGAYARIRKQFKTPIGKFEGIEEALTRIGGTSYRMDAARRLTTAALDQGEKPSVISAILKYHLTEGMRQVFADSMDVHAGRGVCMGPSNYLARGYQGVPISITVEGANILTRSMIIFGQGAIRCHPYLLKEMLAAQSDNPSKALREFDDAFFSHVGFTMSNKVRALVMGLTGSVLVRAPGEGPTRRYLRQLTRMSAAFTYVADVALLILGGEMKRREKLSGRLGDVLSHLYLASATVKHFEDQGRQAQDLPLFEWAMQDSLYKMQSALEDVLANFPIGWMGPLIRVVVFPLGRPFRKPSDELGHKVASLLLSPSACRDRLTKGVYCPEDPSDPVGLMELTMQKVIASEPIEQKIYKATRRRPMPYDYEDVVKEAMAARAISEKEADVVREAMALLDRALQVDEFPGGVAVAKAEATAVVAEAS